ncbi:hypothetical protein BURPSS13_C0124 [Burkholderia pseudomallei S13]|nr:hypothetical protein BURPSS13_C0124 [Burkholderia pseudomallei S13]
MPSRAASTWPLPPEKSSELNGRLSPLQPCAPPVQYHAVPCCHGSASPVCAGAAFRGGAVGARPAFRCARSSPASSFAGDAAASA